MNFVLKVMLTISQAADLLGISDKSLRKIIARSRAKIAGSPVRGPTITFFQIGKGAIRFKPEWIDQFISENTCDPSQVLSIEKARKAKPLPTQTPGFDARLYA